MANADLLFIDDKIRRVDIGNVPHQSEKAWNALLNNDIETWRQLVTFGEKRLSRTVNFGVKSMALLKQIMASRGLQFDMELPSKL